MKGVFSKALRASVLLAPVWLASAWLTFQTSPATAQGLTANPQVSVEYLQPSFNSASTDPNQSFQFKTIYDWLLVRRPLEELSRFLMPLRLPRPIKIQVDECGAQRRPYLSGGPVTICYELINEIEKVAAGMDDKSIRQMIVVGTFTEAVLHETAYAVFDVLGVPVWGRQEDAADRLAAFILMQFPEAVAHTAMVGSAEFFLLSKRTWTGIAFADPSSPQGQRFYNFLCIGFGGDRLSFGGWAESHDGRDPLLPVDRARDCRREYEQVRNAFNLRIMPFVDPELLVRAKATQWFYPHELGK